MFLPALLPSNLVSCRSRFGYREVPKQYTAPRVRT